MVEGPTSGEYDFDTIYVTYYYDKNTGTGDIMPPQTGFEPSTINNNRVEVITLYKKKINLLVLVINRHSIYNLYV